MKVLSETGATHDIAIDENGILAVSSGRSAYAEIVSAITRTLLGEIQLDPSLGIDYMGTVFRSVSRIAVWKHFVKQALSRLPFVKGIVSFDASYKSSSRTMTYNLNIMTDDGTVAVSSQT